MRKVDLLLDQDAFSKASNDLDRLCDELTDLRSNIKGSFALLKEDWQSDAGEAFFTRFEKDVLKSLKDYSLVFERMASNLRTASREYAVVFDEAEKLLRG